MFDFHVHSHFSADCQTPMEAMVEGALQKGLQIICFTDHLDYDYAQSVEPPEIIFEFNLAEQDALVRRLRQKYGHKITILRGVELGLQPHVLAKYQAMLAQEKFDFVLASLHTVRKCDIYKESFYSGRAAKVAYREYLEDLYYCLKHFADYQVVGHLDVIRRYNPQAAAVDVNMFKEEYISIFKVLKAQGKGLEVNTGGLRYGLGDNNPSQTLLKLYRDWGGDIITLGSDAHRVADVGYRFAETIRLLRDLGFRYVCTFREQRLYYHKI